MNKTILITACLFGLLSIILGAFGAHGLKVYISNEALQTFETGVRYQMYHALLLLFVGITKLLTYKIKKTVFYLVVFGVLLFSGSIYGLATNSMTRFEFNTIAFLTPIGGLLLIISWSVLLVCFFKIKVDK